MEGVSEPLKARPCSAAGFKFPVRTQMTLVLSLVRQIVIAVLMLLERERERKREKERERERKKEREKERAR